jgi:Winged helix DNA-binding domain
VPTLTPRQLNRATLARQLLLAREAWPVARAVEHLGGLQAQTTHTWYVGLWCRLDPFDPHEAGRLLAERELVRLGLQRSTIHLVTADDALWMRPLLAPVLEKPLSSFARNLDGVDRDAVAAAARPLLAAEPLGWAALGRRLAEHWPGRDPASLAQIARARLALVQVPPRGVWGRSGQALHTTAETYLDRPLDDDPSVERLLLRYLAAFGPASAMDAQAWCGLTRLAAVADRLRDRLIAFRDEQGRELLDLPDAPRPDPDVPAPVRFLYDYDNLLLSHADRSRFSGPRSVGRAFADVPPQRAPGAVLVDGVVHGSWLLDRERKAATLVVRTTELPKAQLDEVVAEGEALLALVAADADKRRVTISPT